MMQRLFISLILAMTIVGTANCVETPGAKNFNPQEAINNKIMWDNLYRDAFTGRYFGEFAKQFATGVKIQKNGEITYTAKSNGPSVPDINAEYTALPSLSGLTPLMEAVSRGPRNHYNYYLVKFMIEMGANPNLTFHGKLPLEIAVENNRLDAVKLLAPLTDRAKVDEIRAAAEKSGKTEAVQAIDEAVKGESEAGAAIENAAQQAAGSLNA